MSGLYPPNDSFAAGYSSERKHGSVAGSYYFRQYELKRIYSKNFYRGMAIALAIHAVFILFLFWIEPIYTKPPDVEKLLPPVSTDYQVIQLRIVGEKASGMDVQGSGGGQGTIRQNAGAAFGKPVPSSTKNTIDPQASVVPRSLQGPGMNDVVGMNRSPVYFDTVKGYSGSAQNGEGSGGGTGGGIGNKSGSGAGFTDKPGFGGGFGNKFVPGNPANNSATGSPYQISWNGVARALLSGDKPGFPGGVQHGGTVKIRITVDPGGNVMAMVPLEKADSRLEEAAMSAIRTWRFSKLARKYPQIDQQATATFVFKAE
jgi:TonB family protein